MKKVYILSVLALLIAASLICYALYISDLESDPLHRASQLPTDISLIVGQNLIVGIYGKNSEESIIKLLDTVKPGGIILYGYNIRSENQLTLLINNLQSIATRTTNLPYLIMVDEEPGGSTRLDLFSNVITKNGVDWARIEEGAMKMNKMGINVDLGPLVESVIVDNSAVTRRVMFQDEIEQLEFNKKFISILQKNNVAATLKHFPGAGLLNTDTHAYIARSTARSAMVTQSVDSFRKNSEISGADFMMTSHGIYNSIDQNNSVTVSKKAVDVIRSSINYKGILITDDILGMPIGNPTYMKPTDVAFEALKAGHTMIMLSAMNGNMMKVREHLLAKYNSDENFKRQVEKNYLQIQEYKRAHLMTGK